MSKPVHPAVMTQLAQFFHQRVGMDIPKSVRVAAGLIEFMREWQLDIVKSSWMDDPEEAQDRRPRWDQLAQDADDWMTARDGIKPWLPPELT